MIAVLVGGLYFVLSDPSPPSTPDAPQADTTLPSDAPITTDQPSTDDIDKSDVWSRVFDERTLTLLRIGLVLFAAFVIAGVVQRVVVGEYHFTTPILAMPPSAASLAEVGNVRLDLKVELDNLRAEIRKNLAQAASGDQLGELEQIVNDLIDVVDELMVAIQSQEEPET